jgi:hypothetical protein
MVRLERDFFRMVWNRGLGAGAVLTWSVIDQADQF